MYLSHIEIEGYKIFKDTFTAYLNKDLTVIVGENGTGKSAIVDSIRVLLSEDEFGRIGIKDSDFHRELSKQSKEKGVERIKIKGRFSELNKTEQIAYLPWLDYSNNTNATLNIEIENKEDSFGRFKWNKWGNETKSGIFEAELIESLRCIYLPPLRNAPEKLQAYRGSRLSRLIRNVTNISGQSGKHNIEDKANEFNKELLKDEDIQKIDKIIKEKIIDSVGSVFGQDAMIQFSEVNFNRIIERLKLLFFPKLLATNAHEKDKMYRELDENSLGYNNILYLATVLAELEGLKKEETFLKILLIEEPEAHLHPQLQSKLLQYLKVQSRKYGFQIIVTTHSPTLTASVNLDYIKVITQKSVESQPLFCELSKCGLKDKGKFFIERWLDLNKSILLFARGVIFVEGIAEALILPELAKTVIKKYFEKEIIDKKPESLEDFGISVININGIYFDYFMQLFSGYIIDNNTIIETEKINVFCAGITDNDPKKDECPTTNFKSPGNNRCLYLIKELKKNSKNCRLYSNLKTFEYDLALTDNNLAVLLGILNENIKTEGKLKEQAKKYLKVNWESASEKDKAEASQWLLKRLEKSNPIGKGEFAQIVSYKLASGEMVLSVPNYISRAVRWTLRGQKRKLARE